MLLFYCLFRSTKLLQIIVTAKLLWLFLHKISIFKQILQNSYKTIAKTNRRWYNILNTKKQTNLVKGSLNMIHSMTGFGRCETEINGREISVEIKSVNHRYFEFNCRTPRAYSFLDEKLKSYTSTRVSRGKIDMFVLKMAALRFLIKKCVVLI